MPKRSPFRYFKTSPEVIRLAVMLYLHLPDRIDAWQPLAAKRLNLP